MEATTSTPLTALRTLFPTCAAHGRSGPGPYAAGDSRSKGNLSIVAHLFCDDGLVIEKG